MFEAVSQPVLITFEPTRGQKVCSLSATSEAACVHTHSFLLSLLCQDVKKRPARSPYELKDRVF